MLDQPQSVELLRCRSFQVLDLSFLLGVKNGANLGLYRLFESTLDLFVKRELTETSQGCRCDLFLQFLK